MLLANGVHRNLYRINGFLHPTDAMVFCTILQGQEQQKIVGGLVEIGVFYGRSLYLLGESARLSGDLVLGIDLFDISGQKAYVDKILAKHLLNDIVILRNISSFDTTAKFITDNVGRVRFFHIDGGHEYRHLENDAKLANETIKDDGVIVFDDFLNAQYPDLTVAILDFLRVNKDKYAPFCITKSKLYIAQRAYKEQYMTLIRDTTLWNNAYKEEFDFLGDTVVHVSQSVLNRAIYEQFAKFGFGKQSRLFVFSVGRSNTRQ